MAQQTALVTDFDGTISEDDFFTLVAEKYLVPEDLRPWQEYLNGRLTHFTALNRVFAKIHIPEAELREFIGTIALDDAFAKVAACCAEKDIPVYICSAGCDYYINILLKELIKRYQIRLVTNTGRYTPQGGLVMTPPHASPFYDQDVGISKAGVVSYLQENGFSVIFCGDGPPDVTPARLAQTVFAKKYLLAQCRREHIATRPFRSFCDVLAYIKEL